MELAIQIIISGILLGGVYSLIGIGLTLVFGVVKVVNFAHGDLLMLSMFCTYWVFYFFGIDPYIAVVIVVPIFFIVGVFVQRVIFQPIMNAQDNMKIGAIIGFSIIAQNLALFLWSGNYRTVSTSYQNATLKINSFIVSVPKLVAFVVAMLITWGLFTFLEKTFLGKAIRAVSQDTVAARLMGIKTNAIYMTVFGIGTACVAVAGCLLMPSYYVFPQLGTYFILISFVVAVLGGMGNIYGALISGIIVGIVESVSGYFVSELKEAVLFVLFIIVLLIRPNGLFGKGRR